MERVKERVARGGHNIPSEKIKERWVNSIHNMTMLIPKRENLKVYDNSNPLVKGKPSPVLLFSMQAGKFKQSPIKNMPDWAKPLATAATEAC